MRLINNHEIGRRVISQSSDKCKNRGNLDRPPRMIGISRCDAAMFHLHIGEGVTNLLQEFVAMAQDKDTLAFTCEFGYEISKHAGFAAARWGTEQCRAPLHEMAHGTINEIVLIGPELDHASRFAFSTICPTRCLVI